MRCFLPIALAVLLSLAGAQRLPNEAVDEWDSLDVPTKETYVQKANDASIPDTSSGDEAAKESASAAPARQA